MGTIDISIGPDNDLIVFDFADIECFALPCTDRCDPVIDFGILLDTGSLGLLDVENLTAEREDSLCSCIPSLHGRTACRVSLDDEELTL